MGCFCEKLAHGGALRHLEVVSLAPGKMLGLTACWARGHETVPHLRRDWLHCEGDEHQGCAGRFCPHTGITYILRSQRIYERCGNRKSLWSTVENLFLIRSLGAAR